MHLLHIHVVEHLWLIAGTSLIHQGFLRVFNDITDIVLDVPNAYHTLGKFVEKSTAAGFVSSQVAAETPQRYVRSGLPLGTQG